MAKHINMVGPPFWWGVLGPGPGPPKSRGVLRQWKSRTYALKLNSWVKIAASCKIRQVKRTQKFTICVFATVSDCKKSTKPSRKRICLELPIWRHYWNISDLLRNLSRNTSDDFILASGTFWRRHFGDGYLSPSFFGAELFWRWAVLVPVACREGENG